MLTYILIFVWLTVILVMHRLSKTTKAENIWVAIWITTLTLIYAYYIS